MRTKTTLVGLALLALLAAACGSGDTDTAGPGAQGGGSAPVAAKGKKSIVLEVSGPKSADVTYSLGSDTSQEGGAKLPWKKELTSGEALIIPSIVAQSKGTGEIACKITIDGKIAKENKSSGQFAVVTCTADAIG